MTDHQKKNWKSYCSEPLELVENYMAAKADDFEGWCMHHKLEIQSDGTRVSVQELKDQGLYYDRPSNELVFMRFGEHTTLHMLGNARMKGKQLSEETRKKLSQSLKGKSPWNIGRRLSADTRQKMSESRKGKNHPFFGKHRSAETCKKIAEANKGRRLSADTRQKMSESWKGMLWWNNGISSTRSRECPGPEWKRGRLKVSTTNCRT